MRNRLKKYFTSTQSLKNSYLKGFASFFKARCFRAYDIQCIARGVAAGLAGAVIPGFQLVYAAILVIIFRGNLPIALLFTLITNPFTVVPIMYLTYLVGTLIIGNGKNEFVLKPFQWNFTSFHDFWSNVSVWTLQFGKAFLIGVPIVSISLAIIGYFTTLFIGRIIALFFISRRNKSRY